MICNGALFSSLRPTCEKHNIYSIITILSMNITEFTILYRINNVLLVGTFKNNTPSR